MNKFILSAVFFLFSSASWAVLDENIRITLEEPSSHAAASGVSNLRGWAVASNGIDRVELFINDIYIDDIPYGSIRTDVGDAFPAFPDSDNSGYSMAWAYSIQDAGTNHMTIVAYDNTGNYNIAETDFQVEKFISSFITDPNEVDLRTAVDMRALDNNRLLIEGVTVEGQEWDVVLKWQTATQGFDIALIDPIAPPPPVGTPETEVGGIISSNTVWSLANAPYLITSEVQIAYGVTLTIDPGVRVIGPGNIKVFGTLNATGVQNNKITFDDVHVVPGGGPSDEWFKILIDYADINSGSIYYATGNSVQGSISLRNSTITDMTAYMYIVYPKENCIIERNIFIRSATIDVATSNTNIYIRNNVFYQQRGAAIESFASYNTSETVVEYNSFLSTDRVALSLPSGYTTANISTATNNYWGTVDTAVIDSMIFDKNDDLGVANYIDYEPFLTEPHPNTPVY